MSASSLAFRAAVIFLLAGITWGMIMGISQDHSAFPAHAHLNLLGWVSLFLMGLYYRLHPEIEAGRLALPQIVLWIAGSAVHPMGMGLVLGGHMFGGPMIGIGSIQLSVSLLLFGWQVFRGETAARKTPRMPLAPTPAH